MLALSEQRFYETAAHGTRIYFLMSHFFIDNFFLTKNSDFVELQIDYLEELGLYVDNLRFVTQENCDDGIGRPDCGITDESIGEICSFDFENFILNVEAFLQTSIDFLFNMFQ